MVEAFFKLVLTTSLYASVVGVVLLTLKAVLKNKINPKWHYIIWIVLILKLLIPFGPQSAVSLFNTIPHMPEQTNFTQMYEEYQQNYNIIQESGDKTYLPTTRGVKNSSLKLAPTAQKALPYIWLVGVALMLGWLLLTNYLLNRKIKRSALPITESINTIFEDCKKKMGLKGGIQVVIQNVIHTPSLFGVFNPKILISPESLKLSEKEISYILLHELAHYKRKDLIANHLLLLLQSIHWFNPIIWYCFKRLRQDMEVAADEQVLKLLESGEQKEYGKALLSVLEKLSFTKLAPRLIGMVDDKKNIEERIKMIKMVDFFRRRRKTSITIGILCVAVLSSMLLTNGLTKSNSEEVQTKTTAKDKDIKEDKTPSNNTLLKLATRPEKYSLAMSSTPGIRITPEYTGIAAKVEYSTTAGTLLTWGSPDGKITQHGQKVELPLDTPVYWSPLMDGEAKTPDIIEVKATVLDNYGALSQKSVNIKYDSTNYVYTVMQPDDITNAETTNSQSQKPKSIEEAVSQAVKKQRKAYADGEAYTEGHIILDTEEKDGNIKAYTFASYGAFGFENGIFTKISGSGAIPTVITLKKDEDSGYSLIEYKEPMDGAGYIESTKKMFPKKLWDTVLKQRGDQYLKLARQQEEQAEQYLKSIGRNAEVSEKSVDKKLLQIDIEASDKIFAEFTKHDGELNNFPTWIGTRELIQNGVRYIYEVSQSKSQDGYDIVNFKKTEENGIVVKEYSYKIVGHEPLLIEQQ